MRKNLIYFSILIVFIVITFFLLNNSNSVIDSNNYLKIAGQKIKIELVSTPSKLAQGLSGRAGLKENEGMLFVFEQAGNYSFWMKDMKFSIDIIWLSEDKKVVYLKKDARPESFPEMYGLKVNAKYVLEVISGFSEKYNLKVGDKVEF